MSGTAEVAQHTIYNSSGEVGHNCIQGWTGSLGGIGNIAADPCFADPCDGDYHLVSEGWRWDNNSSSWQQDVVTSRCIDAGNPGFVLNDEPLTVPDDPYFFISNTRFVPTSVGALVCRDWPVVAPLVSS